VGVITSPAAKGEEVTVGTGVNLALFTTAIAPVADENHATDPASGLVLHSRTPYFYLPPCKHHRSSEAMFEDTGRSHSSQDVLHTSFQPHNLSLFAVMRAADVEQEHNSHVPTSGYGLHASSTPAAIASARGSRDIVPTGPMKLSINNVTAAPAPQSVRKRSSAAPSLSSAYEPGYTLSATAIVGASAATRVGPTLASQPSGADARLRESAVELRLHEAGPISDALVHPVIHSLCSTLLDSASISAGAP
jgi:hypothetical protein